MYKGRINEDKWSKWRAAESWVSDFIVTQAAWADQVKHFKSYRLRYFRCFMTSISDCISLCVCMWVYVCVCVCIYMHTWLSYIGDRKLTCPEGQIGTLDVIWRKHLRCFLNSSGFNMPPTSVVRGQTESGGVGVGRRRMPPISPWIFHHFRTYSGTPQDRTLPGLSQICIRMQSDGFSFTPKFRGKWPQWNNYSNAFG